MKRGLMIALAAAIMCASGCSSSGTYPIADCEMKGTLVRQSDSCYLYEIPFVAKDETVHTRKLILFTPGEPDRKLPLLYCAHYWASLEHPFVKKCLKDGIALASPYEENELEANRTLTDDNLVFNNAAFYFLSRLPMIDASRMAVFGESAGGYMTLMISSLNMGICASAAMSPLTNCYFNMYKHFRRAHEINQEYMAKGHGAPMSVIEWIYDLFIPCIDYYDGENDIEKWEKLSPIGLAQCISAPLQICHFTSDMLVPIDELCRGYAYDDTGIESIPEGFTIRMDRDLPGILGESYVDRFPEGRCKIISRKVEDNDAYVALPYDADTLANVIIYDDGHTEGWASHRAGHNLSNFDYFPFLKNMLERTLADSEQLIPEKLAILLERYDGRSIQLPAHWGFEPDIYGSIEMYRKQIVDELAEWVSNNSFKELDSAMKSVVASKRDLKPVWKDIRKRIRQEACRKVRTFHVNPENFKSAISQARALSARGTGTKLVFHGGEYHLDSEIGIYGVQDGMVLCAARGETPVIDGSTAIKGWQKDGEIWKTHLDCNLGVAVGMTDRFDLYCNGELQTLARWPNEGSFSVTGTALGKTPIPENWAGFVGSYEGVLSFEGTPSAERFARWAEEPDVWTLGYWFWDWYESYQKVEKIDVSKCIMELQAPGSEYGYRGGARYYALNLLCELDAEKEFYLDRRDSTLYWIPPKGVNPETADVRASVFGGEQMIAIHNCENVVIDGLAFRCGRSGAVTIDGGRGNVLTNCNIVMFGGDAVKITGKDHLVSGCRLCELGCGGLIVSGGDRKTLETSGHRITDTTVDHFSLFKHTYKPAVLFDGVGLHIDHCLFSRSTSSALRYQANDILVEYNIFRDLVRESDDQGGIDTWYDLAERGNVIRYNYWKDINGGVLAGAAAIRFDDMISGQTVYGNVIENCGGKEFGGVQIHGGRDNHIYSNLFISCPYAVSCLPWEDEKWSTCFAGQKQNIERYDVLGDLYTERYPELKDIMDGNNNRNFIHDNLAVDVGEFGFRTHKNEMSNNTVIASDGRGIEYFTRASVLKKYGLKPIPFEEMGPRH